MLYGDNDSKRCNGCLLYAIISSEIRGEIAAISVFPLLKAMAWPHYIHRFLNAPDNYSKRFGQGLVFHGWLVS